MTRFVIILMSLFTLIGCVDDEPLPPTKMPLVVEGWIEQGEAPVVIVTHAIDLTVDSASFEGFVEKWGRVSVFDGDKRYILTGRINKNYTPGFIFTSSRLVGEPGHTYRLLIETETDTVEAVAHMLPSAEISRIEVERQAGSDSLYSLRAYVDKLDSEAHYKFFARSHTLEKRFYGSFLGTFPATSYNPEQGMTITRGIHSPYEDAADNFNHYYTLGDRVSVKLCTLEPQIYDFWHAYDSNVSLSQNIFFTFAGNCPSNIRGGLGYWAAYGTFNRTVVIR